MLASFSVLTVYNKNQQSIKRTYQATSFSREDRVLISYKLLTCDRTGEKDCNNVSSMRDLFYLFSEITSEFRQIHGMW